MSRVRERDCSSCFYFFRVFFLIFKFLVLCLLLCLFLCQAIFSQTQFVAVKTFVICLCFSLRGCSCACCVLVSCTPVVVNVVCCDTLEQMSVEIYTLSARFVQIAGPRLAVA